MRRDREWSMPPHLCEPSAACEPEFATGERKRSSVHGIGISADRGASHRFRFASKSSNRRERGAFLTTVLRRGGTPPGGGNDETDSGNPATPVILQVSQSSATTDVNGLANITPSAGAFSAPLEVDVAVTTGSGALLDYPIELLPAAGNSPATPQPPNGTIPARNVGPTAIEENERSQRRTEQPAPW